MKKEITIQQAQKLIDNYKNNYKSSPEKLNKYKLESQQKTKLYLENRLITDKDFSEQLYNQIWEFSEKENYTGTSLEEFKKIDFENIYLLTEKFKTQIKINNK